MKVLVTGGAGFIGSHVCAACVEAGHEVLVVDDLSKGRRENVSGDASFFELDINDPGFGRLVEREKPLAVIHLAAQSSATASLRDVPGDAAVNIMGMLRVLEACREAGVQRLVYASSAAVYGDPLYLPVDEQHPLAPKLPYAVAKHAAELYAKLYCEQFGLNCAVLRMANVYGPGQDAGGEGGVVAVFREMLLGGQRPVIFGDGMQTRDFVYVKDVARAVLLAMAWADQAGAGGPGVWADAGMPGKWDIFNVSTGVPVEINRLQGLMQGLVGAKQEVLYRPARRGDILHSCLDNQKAVSLLGWRLCYGLEEGLGETVGPAGPCGDG